MTASLIVAGYETFDNSVQRPVQLSGLGWIPGEPLPDQATIEQKYLDGEAVTGDRTRNRHMRIPVWIRGNDPLDLAANLTEMWQAINEGTFTVVWTPDGGLPVIYDCFRAVPQRPNNSYLADQGVTAFMIECDAKPFGRSPDVQTVAVQATLQIDSFDTAPTGATRDTTVKFEGTASASVTLLRSGFVFTNATPVTRTFTAVNLSTYSGLSLRVLPNIASTVTVAITLGSAAGSTRYTATAPAGSSWQLASFSLATGTPVAGSGVNLTAVTSESITLTMAGSGSISSFTVHLDDLRATAGSAVLSSTARGAVLAVPGILGAARTPVSLALSGTTMATAMLHAPPIDQDSNAAILIANAVGASPDAHTAFVAAANSGYQGTYGVWLGTTAAPSGANTVSLTIYQIVAGLVVATQVLTASYTGAGPTGRLIPIDEVTLPLLAVPDDNTTTNYQFDLSHTAGGDSYSDILLTDTRGQTIVVAPPTAVPSVYIDEPGPLQFGPRVFGTAASLDRTQAYGILGSTHMVGGPVIFEPGSNKLLTWGNAAAPSVTATYYPRWPFERVV